LYKFKIHIGDALTILKTRPDQSVHCCVTSPPYWNLRDYGVEGQLGLEKSPFEYIDNLVEICMEIHRVLRDNGTFWMVIGETYCNCKGTAFNSGGRVVPNECCHSRHKDANAIPLWRPNKSDADAWGLKQKDLIMIPNRVAIKLQESGWYVRSQIVWNKPNPIPSSVKDRPTLSHEYVFFMTKSHRYYYDHEAIKEPVQPDTLPRYERGRSCNHKWDDGGPGNHTIAKSFDHMKPKGGGKKYSNNSPFANRTDSQNLDKAGEKVYTERNKRSVWTVATRGYHDAHFAVFPPELIEPCILAGCPEGGIVLDPFAGSGTTGEVALKHFRRFIGIELNPIYANEIAIPRLEREAAKFKQRELFN
jgi:DNA modification methylase